MALFTLKILLLEVNLELVLALTEEGRGLFRYFLGDLDFPDFSFSFSSSLQAEAPNQ